MTSQSAPGPERRRRVLIVDDDEPCRRGFCDTLEAAGYEVAEAWSVVQAMRLLLSFKPDAVLLDLILPDGHGTEIGRAMGAIVTTQRTCVVGVTASARAVDEVDPASFGARRVLLKPTDSAELLHAMSECFDPMMERRSAGAGELPSTPLPAS